MIMKNIERLNVQGEKQQQQQQALMKNLDQLSTKADNQQQQHQVLMKYIESIVNEKSVTTSDTKGSSKSMEIGRKKIESMTISKEQLEETKKNTKEKEDKSVDRNKFRKVEMPVFDGNSPNLWLFKGNHYFQIHKLSNSKKMTVFVISFDGPTLDWY